MERQADSDGRILDEQEDGYDAVVVGSGYGGSVAACRMSMAGIKVCLLEKGRRWKPEDFPTDSLKIASALRMENRNLGFSLGPKDALFQIYQENDSVAAVACGLGGGSLVNAGVMLPTPVRARRNPKWPKEWEVDWDICEAAAAEMLRIQSIPHKFPVAKIMEEIAEGDIQGNSDTPLKISVNFDLEEPPSKLERMGSCMACGNCISGCPYNAKNSTDKNYIHSAIQAGCTVRTGCQVQYVVDNQDRAFPQYVSGGKTRRWRVYLNEFDYITADFVILSAGVFGTTGILFHSQNRGLSLSQALGSGFSCNGNTVAYLDGTAAPLRGHGLGRNQLPEIPFHERPGPSISSSLTSSMGFTIQTAVLPRAYPIRLLKGITTYSWPAGSGFLHWIIDELKHVMGHKSSQGIILNAMGYDKSDGKIMLDKDTDKICFWPPQDPSLPRKIEAFQKLTKKLGGVLFMSRYRSTSVHLLGGCNASSDSSGGVCNHNGQVFDSKSLSTVHEGLYVCDASIIPCSVGINPCLTITAAAEHVSRHLVKDVLKYKVRKNAIGVTVYQKPDAVTYSNLDSNYNSTIFIKETMRGFVGGMPCTACLKMKMNTPNQKASDKWYSFIRKTHPLLRGKVRGYLVVRGIENEELHIIDGEVDMCYTDCKTPYTQYMHYRLLLAASSGKRYIIEGKKTMNPYLFGLYAWKETTTVHVTLREAVENGSKESAVNLKGELKVSFIELLKSLMRLEGKEKAKFIGLLLQTFVRTYIFQVPRGNYKEFDSSDSYYKAYSSSTLHEIEAEDGKLISCRHWKCVKSSERIKEEKLLEPVLLLNGYSGESYWLPTEPHDLVRTLLEAGHDVWLLQSRLHPSNPAISSTIEDIGKYDIPAAINKIVEANGPAVKIHVVAHCVGGLAIHIALMGGHTSAANISSLSCTSTSMFFKLNALSKIKMWLPLVPMSMAILGEDKILPISEESKEASFRHRLLKWIARCIPRYERCTCKECEVFSGIFGNAFWHENISSTLHNWLNKEIITSLPMSAFPHLRKICNTGYIVDTNGNNSYLIHPERMAVSTLYISGGRTVLVTPETSFLANKYMKLHQPGFRHERVVVADFGHSDLLMGEKSCEKVFPHILAHIRLAEQEQNRNGMKSTFKGKIFRKEVLDWGKDLYGPSLYSFPTMLATLLFLFCLIGLVPMLM